MRTRQVFEIQGWYEYSNKSCCAPLKTDSIKCIYCIPAISVQPWRRSWALECHLSGESFPLSHIQMFSMAFSFHFWVWWIYFPDLYCSNGFTLTHGLDEHQPCKFKRKQNCWAPLGIVQMCWNFRLCHPLLPGKFNVFLEVWNESLISALSKLSLLKLYIHLSICLLVSLPGTVKISPWMREDKPNKRK